jgi:hypothetical protein
MIHIKRLLVSPFKTAEAKFGCCMTFCADITGLKLPLDVDITDVDKEEFTWLTPEFDDDDGSTGADVDPELGEELLPDNVEATTFEKPADVPDDVAYLLFNDVEVTPPPITAAAADVVSDGMEDWK